MCNFYFSDKAYFLEHYCQGILKELDSKRKVLQKNDVWIGSGPYLEEAIFNFDSFILSASVIMEYEERDYLATQLNQRMIYDIYPNRDEIGLYLQLNILRNRIVHHTGGRFINAKECSRFLDFSSDVKGIRVENGSISLKCTQIDVYKDEVKKVLPAARKAAKRDKKTVFDVLFPSRKGKGRGKKHPIMIVPAKDIYFDHAETGIKTVQQIQQFLRNLNQAFFDEFYSRCEKKEQLLDMCIGFCEGKDISSYQIKSIFKCEENN